MLFYFLCLCLVGGEVLRIVQEYPHERGASTRLITIRVQEDAQNIKHIDWCGSPIPNPNAPDLKDCQASGLLHRRFVPYQHDLDDPHILYIDPKEVGGWNPSNPSCIIVSANLKRERSLMQIVYFNLAVAAPTIHEIKESTTTQSTSSSSSSAETIVTTGLSTTPPPNVFEVESPARPWRTAAFIFAVGGIGVFCLALGMNMKDGRRRSQEEAEEAEETPLNGFVIIGQLGTGASPAFYQNQHI